MDAIEYFKGMREILCEAHLKVVPKDSVAYQATLKEKEFYDEAIKALEKEPCEDAISRQAVIDSLHSKFVDGFDSDRWWNSMSVLYAINKVPPVSTEKTRWIPVSERLPEMHEVLGILEKLVYMRSDEVIVTIRDNKNGSVVTHSKCYLWEGKWHGDIFDWLKASKVDYEVIAWMPLPQPYKGESEGSDADSD